MAPFPSTKPETVLKQADGLVAVGQHEAALQSLTEMFAAKKFRNTPLASLEPIMMRFIQLCVDLRQGRTAKEGLMQYKNIAQNSSVASIENVIKKFIALCDAKVQEAQEQASKVVGLGDVDDLEASETPESILLGAVSGDQSKDRTDRALVTPWLKFLWEAYRTALETLKNNNRLEAIYQQIVHQAFKFCIKHNRKVEFRRLCETLRLHLANVAKYAHQTHSINLSDPETLQSHLDARFAQLNTSVELELWQEAFRSVEDVHNLLTLAKKAPRPQMMANYYEKLARIFLMSGSALFHASAWSRYHAVVKAAGGKTEEEMSKLAGLVLVSALAVPLGVEGSARVEGGAPGAEETKGRNARLTALIGLSKMPTRSGLLKEALARNTLKASPEPIRQLYQILEVDSHPLTLCATVAPVLQSLSTDSTYSPYLPLLHKVLLSRLLMQLSEVYSSVKISHVLELVAPLNAGPSTAAPPTEEGQAVEQIHYDHPHIEAFVMGCAQRGELQVRVDHAQGSITFATATFSSTTPGLATTSTIVPDIRHRLSRLASSLAESISYLTPPATETASEEQQQALANLVEAANEERARLALNRTLAARRVELLAELTARRNKEESSRKLEATRRAQEEEEKRVAELKKQREREMIQLELESVKKQEAKKLAETLLEKGTLKVDVKQLEDLDSDRLLQLQVEQLDKEKRELQDRLRIISRRLDHSERAFRREEKPLLAEDYAKQQASDRKAYDSYVKNTLQSSKERHQESIQAKQRLSRMMNDFKVASKEIAGKRGAEYRAKKEAAEAKMVAEMQKRREKILKERREEDERLAEEERMRTEMEEEEARRAQEEEEAEERRRAEEEATREEEERKKADEQAELAEKRKQREAERQKDLELARRRTQLEEEAAARRQQKAAPPAEKENAWRPSRIQGSATPTASTPTPGSPALRPTGGAYRPPGARGAAEGTTTPATATSPPASVTPTRAPSSTATTTATATATATAGPSATAGARPGGWRDRMAAKETSGTASNGRNSPAPGSPKPSTPKPLEDEGFQTVPPKQAWKPKFRRDGQ